MHEEHSPLARKAPKLDVAKGAENFLNANMLGPNRTASSIFNEGAKITKELTAKIDRFSDDLPSKTPPKRSDLTYLKPEEWSNSPDRHEGTFGSQQMLPTLPKQAILTRTKTIDISLQGEEKSGGSRNTAHQLKHLNQIMAGPIGTTDRSAADEKAPSVTQGESAGAISPSYPGQNPREESSRSGLNVAPASGFTKALHEQGVAIKSFGDTTSGYPKPVYYDAPANPQQTMSTAEPKKRDSASGGVIAQRSAEIDDIIREWEQRLQVVETKIEKNRTAKDYLSKDIIQTEESLRNTNLSLSQKTEKLKELEKLLASAKDSAMKIATTVDGLSTALDRELASKFKRKSESLNRPTH